MCKISMQIKVSNIFKSSDQEEDDFSQRQLIRMSSFLEFERLMTKKRVLVSEHNAFYEKLQDARQTISCINMNGSDRKVFIDKLSDFIEIYYREIGRRDIDFFLKPRYMENVRRADMNSLELGEEMAMCDAQIKAKSKLIKSTYNHMIAERLLVCIQKVLIDIKNDYKEYQKKVAEIN